MRPSSVLLALLLAGSPLAAQSVAGRLAEEGSGRPIEGAVVVLLDEAGAQRTGTLTDASGRFSLRAPGPGHYRLRAERIGFRGTLSPPFGLAAGEEAERDLAAPAEAIRLGGVAVEGERRCVIRPAEGMRAATLWEEARKALNAASVTEAQRLVRFRLRSFERRLDPQFLRPVEEEAVHRTHVGSRPFASLPPEDLAAGGYVRPEGGGFVYFAPDADVLLSDGFLDTHCFRVRPGDGETRGMVGLAFEPLRGRRLPDIEGVLWLDALTAELRFVEFGYTRIPLRRDAAQGGRVEYRRLPGGAWIVSRWWIRMPLLGRDPSRRDVTLLGVKEAGGEVEEIVDGPAAVAVLEGTVRDEAGAPLAGATVFVSGTSHTAVTDSAGAFRLEAPLAGEHVVGVLHPRLRSLGPSPTRTVVLVRGRTVTVDFSG